jgi:hypothetical protein
MLTASPTPARLSRSRSKKIGCAHCGRREMMSEDAKFFALGF